MPEHKKPTRRIRWWILPFVLTLLLSLCAVPLLFLKNCLNSDFIHQQISLYAQQQDISIRYGNVTNVVLWRGISVDHIELKKNNMKLILTDVSYSFQDNLLQNLFQEGLFTTAIFTSGFFKNNAVKDKLFKGTLHTAQANIAIAAAPEKSKSNKSQANPTQPIPSKPSPSKPNPTPIAATAFDPSLLATLPMHIQFDVLHLEVAGATYHGALTLLIDSKIQAMDTIIDGRLMFDDARKNIAASVKTTFRYALATNQLRASQLALHNKNTQILIHQLQITNPLQAAKVSMATIVFNSAAKPLMHVLASRLDNPPAQLAQLHHIHIEASDFTYAPDKLHVLVKQFSVSMINGEFVHLSGPLQWQRQHQRSQWDSNKLMFLTSSTLPRSWGLASHHQAQVKGQMNMTMRLAQNGAITWPHLNINSLIQLGTAQWHADLIAQSVRLHAHQLTFSAADISLKGNRDISIAKQYIKAGKYHVALADSTFDFADAKNLHWQTQADIQTTLAGMPALDIHLNSQGQRKPDRTLFKTLNISLKSQPMHDGMHTNIQGRLHGTLHDQGFAHRSSQLQGTFSMHNIAGLRNWIEAVPDWNGKAHLSWESKGRGMDQLDIKGILNLSDFSFKNNQINLLGGKLSLPFQQQINLTNMHVKKTSTINHTDLSRIASLSLPGSLSFQSLSMRGFKLLNAQLALQLSGDVLTGKITQASLLGGHISGYFQVTKPKKKQAYPNTYARLSLLHADSAQLNPNWQTKPSHFNLYTTIKSDGSYLSGRASIPNIRRKSLDHLIAWLDPNGEKPTLQNIKKMIKKYGYAPSSIDAKLQHQYADIDVVLKSHNGYDIHIPIHNLSVGHLITP